MGVSRGFHGSVEGVFRGFKVRQGSVEVVLRVFQGCKSMFQGYLKG